jgi:hypothetical protein
MQPACAVAPLLRTQQDGHWYCIAGRWLLEMQLENLLVSGMLTQTVHFIHQDSMLYLSASPNQPWNLTCTSLSCWRPTSPLWCHSCRVQRAKWVGPTGLQD